MDNSLLIGTSIAALGFRITALGILGVVIVKQLIQFRYKSDLQPLKRLLLAMVVLITVSNFPIIKVHLDRISQAGGSTPEITSIATLTNAVSMLLIAIILYVIYGFKQKDK